MQFNQNASISLLFNCFKCAGLCLILSLVLISFSHHLCHLFILGVVVVLLCRFELLVNYVIVIVFDLGVIVCGSFDLIQSLADIITIIVSLILQGSQSLWTLLLHLNVS